MATIKPFAAVRAKAELAARVCELPYDVFSSEEARRLAAGNPLSFLRVSKPEIELPAGGDPHAPEVYAKGRENYQRWLAQGVLRREPAPRFYLYRQVMGAHSQLGLVAAASCREYLTGGIKRHELTRPDKEDDRLRHIEGVGSQTGPVFLVYRASAAIDALLAAEAAQPPETDFTAPDGVRHSAWVVADRERGRGIEAAFARVPCLYIADGHHRCAAAVRLYQRRQAGRTAPPAEDESAWVLSVIFPHNQLQILPYNRVVKDLNGLTTSQLFEKLKRVAEIEPGGPAPKRRHELALWVGGQWHTLRFRPGLAGTTDPIGQLDVTLLQDQVLGPIFGIADPRASQRLNFVGGGRGTGELEKLVSSGEYACAFSMFPTRIDDMMSVADAGGLMPPKSTWFEPKLRDGLFCHDL
jgi:uncharacterized protein (DUF1015 family)